MKRKKKQIVTLNDYVKYRINDKGYIRLVNGYALDKGKTYKVVYSHYKEAVAEVITEMR